MHKQSNTRSQQQKSLRVTKYVQLLLSILNKTSSLFVFLEIHKATIGSVAVSGSATERCRGSLASDSGSRGGSMHSWAMIIKATSDFVDVQRNIDIDLEVVDSMEGFFRGFGWWNKEFGRHGNLTLLILWIVLGFYGIFKAILRFSVVCFLLTRFF